MSLFKKWFGKKPAAEAVEAAAETAQPAAARPVEAVSPPSATEPEKTPVKTAPERIEAPPGTATGPEPPPEPATKLSAWTRLRQGLTKTRKGIAGLFSLRRALDDAFVDELEAELYAADFGPQTVAELIDSETGVRAAWKAKEITQTGEVREYLKRLLRKILEEKDTRLLESDEKPTVILVAGVNGTGKTTSIAKLAKLLLAHDKRVLLAAGDTFRAAAVEQLSIWSRRLGIDIVKGAHAADPASVAYRAADEALAKGVDYLIVDTAGRLHTQKNLMRELEKIRDVLAKKIPGAPHECLLVLDATTGQNALSQAESFLAAVRVTGIVLAKLDGTAKGGIVVAIHNRLRIPVKFVGVGEKLDDLQHFHADSFVEALLEAE